MLSRTENETRGFNYSESKSHLVGVGGRLGSRLLGSSWLAELLLQKGVEVSGDLIHVDGIGAFDEDAAVGSVQILDVGLVVVGLNFVHARFREVAHVHGPVSVVSHGRPLRLDGAQAGGEVRVELLGRCILLSTLVAAAAAGEGTSNQGSTSTDGNTHSKGGLDEGSEGDEGGTGDGGEGNHFC